MDTNTIFLLAIMLLCLFLIKSQNKITEGFMSNYSKCGLAKREMTSDEIISEKNGQYPSSFKNYKMDLWHCYWRNSQEKNSAKNVRNSEKYLGPVDASYKSCPQCYYPLPYPINGKYKFLA